MNQLPSTARPILLVEDNPADLDLTRRAFQRSRLVNPLQVARDGQEAVNSSPAGGTASRCRWWCCSISSCRASTVWRCCASTVRIR